MMNRTTIRASALCTDALVTILWPKEGPRTPWPPEIWRYPFVIGFLTQAVFITGKEVAADDGLTGEQRAMVFKYAMGEVGGWTSDIPNLLAEWVKSREPAFLRGASNADTVMSYMLNVRPMEEAELQEVAEAVASTKARWQRDEVSHTEVCNTLIMNLFTGYVERMLEAEKGVRKFDTMWERYQRGLSPSTGLPGRSLGSFVDAGDCIETPSWEALRKAADRIEGVECNKSKDIRRCAHIEEEACANYDEMKKVADGHIAYLRQWLSEGMPVANGALNMPAPYRTMIEGDINMLASCTTTEDIEHALKVQFEHMRVLGEWYTAAREQAIRDGRM